MKVTQVHLGLLPIPPNGWGAVEKIIWEYHQNLNAKGLRCEIKYLNDIVYSHDTIVHVHVANLANECHKRGIPYIFTLHDHHAYLYGKNSQIFEENLKAIENSIISTCPSKYLVEYFGSNKLKYFSHAVNTNQFIFKNNINKNKLLCVANNGYANNQSYDRKGFTYAIQAAKDLDLPITIAGPSNNKKFFETLSDDLNNYNKLTKLFDLSEQDLINVYNDHSIFIHASELEAGHPNLTLLEAMSCGLPVVGTFEEPNYAGMIVVDRNVEKIKTAIELINSNYTHYQSIALETAKTNSYVKRIDELINLYDEYTEKLFGEKFIKVYENVQKKITNSSVATKISYSFKDQACVEIENPENVNQVFNIKFINQENNELIYESNLKHMMWAKSSPNYYLPQKIEVRKNDELIQVHNFSLKDKNVFIEYESASLGDQLAWMPIVEQFRKKHQCNLYLKFPLNEIFRKKYREINFVNSTDNLKNIYAVYKLGWYVDSKGVNPGRHKNDPRKIPLQKVASDYLGLEYQPEPPLLDFSISKKPLDKKYVTIGIQSTCQAKYWNNKNGWATVVDYLKQKHNYEVICIDKHKTFGNGKDYINVMPTNALDFTGDKPLTERMNQIYHSDFFIGLPSGLSWLAWSVGVPVVLISGFSDSYTEFKTQYRVQNYDVCTGCWNDSNFDRNDWKWCPKKDKKEIFECTKFITPEMVINTIEKLIKDKNL